MSYFWLDQNNIEIDISEGREINDIMYYKIQVAVSNVRWETLHCYNDFLDLHNLLISDYGLTKDIWPSKKVIRKKYPLLMESRSKELEIYLKNVFSFLKRSMPRIFVQFLDFHLYDIFFLLQTLALELYFEASSFLSSPEGYTFNSMQLHAISEIIKNPFHQVDLYDKRYDVCHVLNFCKQLHELHIEEAKTSAYSNIIPSRLSFELSSFKTLQVLEIKGINLENIYSVGSLRQTLNKLTVHETAITNISQILKCGFLPKSIIESNQMWSSIVEVDLSNNHLTDIDESIKLVPNVEVLNLNQNKISSLSNMSSLSKLAYLSVADNLITSCDNLHLELRNILNLDLSRNSIVSLKDFSELLSVRTLDLSSNKLGNMEEVEFIGRLPCLKNVILAGNAICTTIDYRTKVFKAFGVHSKEIYLDGRIASETELDRAAILRVLQ